MDKLIKVLSSEVEVQLLLAILFFCVLSWPIFSDSEKTTSSLFLHFYLMWLLVPLLMHKVATYKTKSSKNPTQDV